MINRELYILLKYESWNDFQCLLCYTPLRHKQRERSSKEFESEDCLVFILPIFIGFFNDIEAGQEFGQMGQLRDSLDQLRRSDQNNADMLGGN